MHLVRPALRPGVEAALKSLGLLPAAEDDREALCGALVELVTSRLEAGDEFSASQRSAAPAAKQAAAAPAAGSAVLPLLVAAAGWVGRWGQPPAAADCWLFMQSENQNEAEVQRAFHCATSPFNNEDDGIRTHVLWMNPLQILPEAISGFQATQVGR